MLLQAWCSQHHQGNLSATPDKHEAFVTQLYTEALSSPALVDPARYYQNSASSIHTKLLKRHGYVEPDWNPLNGIRVDQATQRALCMMSFSL